MTPAAFPGCRGVGRRGCGPAGRQAVLSGSLSGTCCRDAGGRRRSPPCCRECRQNPGRAAGPPLPSAGFFGALASAFLRAVKWSATSLVAASVSVSATTMSPNAWAVAADMFSARVKLPAAGVLVSATGLAGFPVAGLGTGAGVISGSTLATLAGLNSVVLTPAGARVTGGSTVASPGVLAGLTCATGVDAGAVLAAVLAGDALADAGAATATVWDAAGSAVIAGLVAASAVAVSVTAVTDVALAATAIWACIWYAAGDSEVSSDPIVHVADPFPPGQRAVNRAA